MTHRFINADGLVSTGIGILGHNMFAYCGDNPVNRIDQTGELWVEIEELFKAFAIVKFYPTAIWDEAHGDKNCGYLDHYHLSSAHKNHIWYYGD